MVLRCIVPNEILYSIIDWGDQNGNVVYQSVHSLLFLLFDTGLKNEPIDAMVGTNLLTRCTSSEAPEVELR